MNERTNSDGPVGNGRLIVDRQSPVLRAALWQLVLRAKLDDPLAPVTVVAPSRYASLSLRQEMGREGFANVRFIELPVLAELLGAAALAGRRPLTAVLESIYLRQVLEETTGLLAPVRDHHSTRDSVRAAFRDLRRLDEEVIAILESWGGVSGEVAGLHREFRLRTGGDWYDTEDLTLAAADAVRCGAAPALADLGQVVFHMPCGFTPAEYSLVEALAERDSCAAVLGLVGDAASDISVREMAGTLANWLGEPCLAGNSAAGPSPLPGEAHLHVAPNTHEELRWVIRQMMMEAAERGTSLHRMAILYRMENPYGALIRDELQMAGLPMAGPGRDSLAESAAGRTLTGLLELADSDFHRDRVMGWLTGCPIRLSGGVQSGLSVSRWDSLTRKAGIVSGLEQWRDRLGLHARQLAGDADRWEATEEISEARARRMRQEAATADLLLEFVEQLTEDVRPPPSGSPWSAYCDWAKGLLDDYLSPDIPDDEFTALERIERALDELRGSDMVRPSTTLEEFRYTVADSMRAVVGHLGPTGQGVFVSSFSAAAGMSFDAVWLVGMIEGGAPPSLAPDPLLPERVWQEAGGQSRPEQRISAERYDYLSAVASAPRRSLSYPVAGAASQRQAHPSRWFLEQASELEGNQVHASSLTSLGSRPWMSVDLSSEHALSALPDTGLADSHDYHLDRLLKWRRAGERMDRHPLAREGVLARANRLGRSRYLPRLTEFDGNLSALSAAAEFGRAFRNSAVSPTSLERWAGCPYRYFLGHILHLSALETPEEIASISPLERGSLVHTILERFLVDTQTAGAMPAPGHAWGESDGLRLMQVAEAVFKEAESRGVTGKPLLWELVKQDIRDDLTTFLEEDAQLRESNSTGQLLPEARFGMGGGETEVVDEATGVRFRGVIDRLDISEDGASVLVIDYKTGSSFSYNRLDRDPIDDGKRLQLGVYSLAARRLAPDATSVRAAYWFPTARGGFRFYPRDYFDIDDGRTAQRFRNGISTIAEGIRGGIFPANPGPPDRGKPANCHFCDFDLLCPSRRAEIWERKKADPLLATYHELSSASDGEQ